MVALERLLGKKGLVRTLIGADSQKDLIDLSVGGWTRKPAILQDLCFDRIRLSGCDLKVNFVGCTFEASEFTDLKSKGHFWAANNRWHKCLFHTVELREVISPLNSFRECRFTDVSIINYKIYQTLFDGCNFEGCEIKGLKAELIHNSAHQNPDLRKKSSPVLFQGCTFDKCTFTESFFNGIGFENCDFIETEAHSCDFTGILVDEIWWSAQKSDPFTAFLCKLLEFVALRLGKVSCAYTAIQDYMIDYKSGRIQSQDFSECLYTGAVPDNELNIIEKELPRIMEEYPF